MKDNLSLFYNLGLIYIVLAMIYNNNCIQRQGKKSDFRQFLNKPQSQPDFFGGENILHTHLLVQLWPTELAIAVHEQSFSLTLGISREFLGAFLLGFTSRNEIPKLNGVATRKCSQD